MRTPFTRKTLAFLRALTRNNDRDWFRARRDDYDAHVRLPMVGLLEQLAVDFRRLAPELIAEPRVSMFRVHRDTRFSADKTPFKTNVAAHFPPRGFPRGEGAGLYVEVAPRHVWMGGGIYAPSSAALRVIREHVATDHAALRRIVGARAFREGVGTLDGERLTRVPRGYLPDHPAADLLRHKQFIAGREYPAEFAIDERFYPELLRVFRAVLPLVRFLNTPLREQAPWGSAVASRRGADLR